MPQYSDYTDQQLRDLAAYIHNLRQQGRYKELTAATNSSPGDAILGQKYFEANRAKCHAENLAGLAGKYNAVQLRERLLRPASAVGEHPSAGEVTHARLLENCKDEDVRNVFAYFATLK